MNSVSFIYVSAKQLLLHDSSMDDHHGGLPTILESNECAADRYKMAFTSAQSGVFLTLHPQTMDSSFPVECSLGLFASSKTKQVTADFDTSASTSCEVLRRVLLVVSVLGLEFPHVLVRGSQVVCADFLQNFFQVRLAKRK